MYIIRYKKQLYRFILVVFVSPLRCSLSQCSALFAKLCSAEFVRVQCLSIRSWFNYTSLFNSNQLFVRFATLRSLKVLSSFPFVCHSYYFYLCKHIPTIYSYMFIYLFNCSNSVVASSIFYSYFVIVVIVVV